MKTMTQWLLESLVLLAKEELAEINRIAAFKFKVESMPRMGLTQTCSDDVLDLHKPGNDPTWKPRKRNKTNGERDLVEWLSRSYGFRTGQYDRTVGFFISGDEKVDYHETV